MARRFQIGLSFPGSLRDTLVREVAKILALRLMNNTLEDGQKHVLYDEFHCDEFNKPGLKDELPLYYRDNCEVVAVFLSAEYANRHWCGLEWEKIKDLASDPHGRGRIYLIWHGEQSETILKELGLDRDRDGFKHVDNASPSEVATGILTRLGLRGEHSEPKFISTPMATAIGLPFVNRQAVESIQAPIQRLALVFLSPKYLTLYGYAEEDRYVLYCYIRADAGEVYEPFSLGKECQYIELAHAKRDWALVAKALVDWANDSSRSGPTPLAELFLPCELLHELVESDFLNVQCYPDSADDLLGDEFLSPISLASLCPLVVRPLDRYLHHQLRNNIIHLKRKYVELSAGNGRWIHGGDAASSEALIARRDNPVDVAIRMVSALPPVSYDMVDWLKTMIGSMVPVALWWAVPAHEGWEAHLQSYKSVCESRSLLQIGPAGEVTMLSSDLDYLALQRKRLHHKPPARSLVLMIDNPDLVPDLLASPPTSGSSTPTYSIRSMS
jgi:hypothetical protein